MPNTSREPAPSTLALTARDLCVLDHVQRHQQVAVDQLAALFFSANPYTGRQSANPLRACERRLGTLASLGYVWVGTRHDGAGARRVASLGPLRPRAPGGGTQRRVPPRRLAHHLRTLDAVEGLRRDLLRKGAAVVTTRLDTELQAEARRGKPNRAGTRYALLPDAVCRVRLANGTTLEVAIEYVTSKYTSAAIAAKHDGFGRFDRVVWVADRKSTAARVQAITGQRCGVL